MKRTYVYVLVAGLLLTGLYLNSIAGGQLEINPVQIAGNGILEPGEECDDGNSVNGDGCDNLGRAEQMPGIIQPMTPATAISLHNVPALANVSMIVVTPANHASVEPGSFTPDGSLNLGAFDVWSLSDFPVEIRMMDVMVRLATVQSTPPADTLSVHGIRLLDATGNCLHVFDANFSVNEGRNGEYSRLIGLRFPIRLNPGLNTWSFIGRPSSKLPDGTKVTIGCSSSGMFAVNLGTGAVVKTAKTEPYQMANAAVIANADLTLDIRKDEQAAYRQTPNNLIANLEMNTSGREDIRVMVVSFKVSREMDFGMMSYTVNGSSLNCKPAVSPDASSNMNDVTMVFPKPILVRRGQPTVLTISADLGEVPADTLTVSIHEDSVNASGVITGNLARIVVGSAVRQVAVKPTSEAPKG